MRAEEGCKQIIQHLINEGYRYQLTDKDLNKAIQLTRQCIDQRTIDRWKNALLTFEYLTKTENPKIYKINPLKIPDLINQLKEKPQTKLQ